MEGPSRIPFRSGFIDDSGNDFELGRFFSSARASAMALGLVIRTIKCSSVLEELV